MHPPGLAPHALDGAGDRDRCDDLAAGAQHRRGHRGHPGLALSHGLGPAATSHRREHGGVEAGTGQAPVQAVGLLPGQEDLGARSPEHGHGGAHGDRVAQSDGPLGVGHADAHIALAAVELGRLVGLIAQCGQNGAGGGEQVVLARGRGELAQAGAEDEPALGVPGHQAVVLQGDGDAVGGGARQVSGFFIY